MAAKPGRSDKVLSSIFMSTGLTGLSVIVDLVIMAIISRLIPPSEFGVLAAAMFLLAVCNLLREGGIGSALIQFKTLEPRLIQAGFTLAMGWSILLFVVIQIAAPWYAGFIRIPQLGDVLRVLSLIFPIQAFSLIGQALLQRRLKSPLAATCELAARAFSYLVIGVTLAYSGWGYWALVAAWIGEACILSVLISALTKSV
ncbi:oligosaccharide flippase family protein [Novosphingobium sp. FGD1]|uniref:Oligosaccharide flippase family protein n=1 Tax=Novosphingobium silvae TaxID=2692619 RepID=A0A7X4GKH5_9SPHN|nr:oligosaccharide flippase family protein [Novosphingobium silvae]MYM00347.1 oligosaccharide flippase family protein [Novosphingobium silvae]